MSEAAGLPQKPMPVDEALKVNLYDLEGTPHIIVDTSLCADCDFRPCMRLCPAECFTFVGEKLLFSYEGCLECGTCRVVCPKEAIKWNYPRSGKGIQYRFS